MIRQKKKLINQERQKMKKILDVAQDKIRQEFVSLNYNLSQDTCIFQIAPMFRISEYFIGVKLFIKPLVGIFQGIEFRPEIFFKIFNKSGIQCFSAPRAFNDRRIFHPNINIENCEIIILQFHKQWNPTHTYAYLLRRLKYSIIEPNPHCVPNTKMNRKAAFFYHTRREDYRRYLLKFSPKYLQTFYENSGLFQNYEMIDESQENSNASEFFNVQDLFKNKRSRKTFVLENENQEDEIEMLGKKINTMNLQDNCVPVINNNSTMEQQEKYPKPIKLFF